MKKKLSQAGNDQLKFSLEDTSRDNHISTESGHFIEPKQDAKIIDIGQHRSEIYRRILSRTMK